MIDQLLKIVQQNSGDCVVNNQDVPNQCNAGVQEEVTNSIESTLAGLLKQGKANDVVSLFGSAAGNQSAALSNNPITNLISNNIVKSLGEKFNLPPAVSGAIASTLLPRVLGQFSKQVADPKDKSIDMNSVIGTLLGGGKGQSSRGSGGVDFNSILGQVLSGGAGQSRQSGGGLDVGGLLGSVLGGGKGKKTPAPQKTTPTARKTTASGKKVTPAKGRATKSNSGKDIIGGLLGNILKK